jgi:cytochrome P450
MLTCNRLNSNANPATSWTLAELLKPSNSDLMKRVRAEIDSAKRRDGTIDINALLVLPTLNSAYHETLRLYSDTLVTRTLDENLTLDQYHMEKGSMIISSTWLAHLEASSWENQPPATTWYGERFLTFDEKTGKPTFSTTGLNGKFFPFGGGFYICPGRVFARQEILGAIATFLLTFETDFVEYLKPGDDGLVSAGRDEGGFPKVGKQYPGAGVVVQEGDTLVRLRRRL